MCFVWIWVQTAIISLYSINWLVFITETECVYYAVRTGSLYTASLTFSNSTFCPHTVFMCFVWIWEETAIISLYIFNWLVFITETDCVYYAVRTGSLHAASLTFSNSTFCPHTVCMCFVWIWEQTAIISLYIINRLFLISTRTIKGVLTTKITKHCHKFFGTPLSYSGVRGSNLAPHLTISSKLCVLASKQTPRSYHKSRRDRHPSHISSPLPAPSSDTA